jgi:hypothetical protein
MAKLSARGRTVVVQFSYALDRGPEIDALCDWSRITRAVMSDGAILEKSDVRFRADGRRHSYGWKVRGKLKPGATGQQLLERYLTKGWKQDKV